MKVSLLTILIPVYNEEECIFSLYKRLVDVAEKIKPSIEILFVNDGSTDSSLSIIKGLQEIDTRVSYVDLSRNFGKEKAMCAGIHYVHGDALTIIDADLQDPPELIPEMLEGLENGYDDVYACRSSRKGETWLKQWTAHCYYRCLHLFANIPVQENTGDFRMFSSKAIRTLQDILDGVIILIIRVIGEYPGVIYNETKKRPVYYINDYHLAETILSKPVGCRNTLAIY